MEENKRLLEANNVSTSGTTCQLNPKTEVTSTTPDYAAGLAPLNPPTPAPSTPQHIPSYIAPATPLPTEPIISEPASMYNFSNINIIRALVDDNIIILRYQIHKIIHF